MSTPKIQLAFQGGGAKLAAMLPIAHAFIQAQKDGAVKIEAVAGTSAGAVCAALVATEADLGRVRAALVQRGGAWLKELVPEHLHKAIQEVDRGRPFPWFKHPATIHAIALKGQPVLKTDALRRFFADLLKEGTGRADQTIEQCGRLTIVASDIVQSMPMIHKSGSLLSALVDSCALPVLLRSFDDLRQSHHVDGGLCDNLPVEELLAHDRVNPVFAVFPEDPPEQDKVPRISGLLTYVLALFSASINHGVNRAKTLVPPAFQFPAVSDLGLLDFKRAIALLEDDLWYTAHYNAAMERIEAFAKSVAVMNTRKPANVLHLLDIQQYEDALADLSSGFSNLIEVKRARFTVRINCDKRYSDKQTLAKRVPDTIIRTTEFIAKQAGLPFYRASVRMSDKHVVPTVWSARNVTRQSEVPIRALPLATREVRQGKAKYCLIQFVEADKHIGEGDTIEVKSVYHTIHPYDMSELNFGRSDYFGFTNSQLNGVERAELVLIYPGSLGELSLSSYAPRPTPRRFKPMEFSPEHLELAGEKDRVVGVFLTKVAKKGHVFAEVNVRKES